MFGKPATAVGFRRVRLQSWLTAPQILPIQIPAEQQVQRSAVQVADTGGPHGLLGESSLVASAQRDHRNNQDDSQQQREEEEDEQGNGARQQQNVQLSPDHNPLVPLPPNRSKSASPPAELDPSEAYLRGQAEASRRASEQAARVHQQQQQQLATLRDQVRRLEAEKSVTPSGPSFTSSHKEVQASLLSRESSDGTRQMEALARENEQLMDLVRKHDSLVAEMQQMLEARSAEMVQLHQDAASTLPQLTGALAAATEWQDKYTICAEQLVQVQADCRTQRGQITSLSRQLELQTAATRSLQTQLEELQHRREAHSHAQVIAAVAEHDQQLLEAQAQAKATHKLLEEQRRHASQLQEKLHATGTRAQKAHDDKDQLLKELALTKQQCKEATEAKEALKLQLAETVPRQDVEALKATRQDVAALKATNRSLTAELADVHHALKEAGELIEQLQNDQKQQPRTATPEAEPSVTPHSLRAAVAAAVAHTPAQGSHTPSAIFSLARGPEGGDPEDIVQRLLSALLDYENRSRQWSDERQQLQNAASVAQHELKQTQAELRSAVSSPRKPVNARAAGSSANSPAAKTAGPGNMEQHEQEDARQAAHSLLAEKLSRLESDWRKSKQAANERASYSPRKDSSAAVPKWVQEEGKENRDMQRRLEAAQVELGRMQRQRDSYLLQAKSLQHRLATLQDVTLLSHARAQPPLWAANPNSQGAQC
ncbi:hypothetical protein WJX73_000280 [Symbiochloris irregularis]|uniref:Centrosomal protein of 162 kDa n=1 Tax=Symbiochloris irregularis TaxID=706552 RepID=A0AAW1NIW8_9CHLO